MIYTSLATIKFTSIFVGSFSTTKWIQAADLWQEAAHRCVVGSRCVSMELSCQVDAK